MLKRVTNSEDEQIVSREKTVAERGGKLVFVLIILLVVAVVGFAWSFNNYRQYKKQVARLSTPEGQQQLVKKEMDALLVKVGAHIILPTDEQPTVATIVDPEALAKDQPFYKDSHAGDRVLIYVKAQKAIIYDEKNDILINVGPVFIDKNQAVSVQPNVETAELGDVGKMVSTTGN